MFEGKSPVDRSRLVRQAARLIVEEALEAEATEAVGSGYYERGAKRRGLPAALRLVQPREAVLAAWGITKSGHKVLLGPAPAAKEDTARCRDLLRDLKACLCVARRQARAALPIRFSGARMVPQGSFGPSKRCSRARFGNAFRVPGAAQRQRVFPRLLRPACAGRPATASPQAQEEHQHARAPRRREALSHPRGAHLPQRRVMPLRGARPSRPHREEPARMRAPGG